MGAGERHEPPHFADAARESGEPRGHAAEDDESAGARIHTGEPRNLVNTEASSKQGSYYDLCRTPFK